MESTASYWKPIFNILEGHMEIFVSMPSTCAAVPGRKTDIKDANGLPICCNMAMLRPSFVLPPGPREVRELTRYRISLSEERSRLINRRQQDAGGYQHQTGFGGKSM